MKRFIYGLLLAFLLMVLAGCGEIQQPNPEPNSTHIFLAVSPDALPTGTPGPAPTPFVMKIKNKNVSVDRVVEGPLCNDTWSGTVYVSEKVQVYQWTKSPDFLRNCNLVIEPGTVVYVAHHRDAAYYNGCSCHLDLGTKP